MNGVRITGFYIKVLCEICVHFNKKSICFPVGHFTSRCSSDSSSVTEWNHKEGCYCEKEALLQEFRLKVCSGVISVCKVIPVSV